VIGVAVSLLAPVAVGLYALRHHQLRHDHDAEGLAPLLREMGHNSQALLAFFAVSNVDLIVARHTLSSHDAGLYAAGLILTKAVLFLPQFVSVVAFPSMAADDSSRTFVAALLSVVGLGAVATAATALLPGLALVFVGGPQYEDVRSRLWLFAVLGTLLACLMMVVYGLIARGGSRAVYLTWVGLLAIIGLGLNVDTIPGLLTVVMVVDLTLVVALLVAHQRAAPAAVQDPAAAAVEGFPAP
jgi:O-antigen/teichoic acid export membrane protein